MRPLCPGCSRPLSVCLCDVLPSPPLHINTQIIILQHPHETRQKLATVPILARCVDRCHVIVGRRLHPGSSPIIASLVKSHSRVSAIQDVFRGDWGKVCADAGSRQKHKAALLLFPGPDAVDIGKWLCSMQSDGFCDRSTKLDGECSYASSKSLHQVCTGTSLETSTFHDGCQRFLQGEEHTMGSQVEPDKVGCFAESSHNGNCYVERYREDRNSVVTGGSKYASVNGSLRKHVSSGVRGILGHDRNCGLEGVGELCYKLTSALASNGGGYNESSCVHCEHLKMSRSSGSMIEGPLEERHEYAVDTAQITLLVMDGTWEHAKEMVTASLPLLGNFVTQVCLSYDMHKEGDGMGDADSILRKEPFDGCVSTMEAVARALSVLEVEGRVIEERLLAVLRKMVSLQASYVTSPKWRPKLKKKSSGAQSKSQEAQAT